MSAPGAQLLIRLLIPRCGWRRHMSRWSRYPTLARTDRTRAPSGLAPSRWRRADHAAKGARKVRLIAESAGQGDLAQVERAPDHHRLGQCDAAFGDISGEGEAKGLAEAAGEVARAEPRALRRGPDGGAFAKGPIDIGAHASGLPGQEAFPALLRGRRRLKSNQGDLKAAVRDALAFKDFDLSHAFAPARQLSAGDSRRGRPDAGVKCRKSQSILQKRRSNPFGLDDAVVEPACSVVESMGVIDKERPIRSRRARQGGPKPAGDRWRPSERLRSPPARPVVADVVRLPEGTSS